jgi:hypothetical protein
LFGLFRYFIAITIFIGLMGFLPGESKLEGISDTAFAASDPVIAAAGDIACDPAHVNFNNGNGTSDSCRFGKTQFESKIGVVG